MKIACIVVQFLFIMRFYQDGCLSTRLDFRNTDLGDEYKTVDNMFLKDKDPISLKNSVAIGQIFRYKEDC